MKQLATKKTFWLLAIPAFAVGIFILAQSTAVYAKEASLPHGQMMAEHWKDPGFRTEMQNTMQDHHGANWQNHHQQMHSSDSEP